MKDYQSSKDCFKDYPLKTCIVVCEDQVIYTSEFRGVKPLRLFYQEHGKWQKPLVIIDRIMGKGAVMLAILCGGVKIMTPIISEAALALAETYGLEVIVDQVVPYIVNREGNGRCPIESSVLDIVDLDEGYQAIESAIKKLMENQ